MNEGNTVCKEEIKDIYDAFNCFKRRFLTDKKSIFSDKENIFNPSNLDKILKGFVNNPDESNSSFDDKIKKQLGEENIETHELFAHVVWLWSLVASDMKPESKQNDVNKWLSDDKKVQTDNQFFFDHGIMSTGQYHKTNKPAELIYIINFFNKILKNHDTKYIELIKNGVNDNLEKQEVKIGDSTRKVAMYNILLHLLEPNRYSAISSFGHKEKIVNFFSTQFDISFEINEDLDDKFKKVWDKAIEEFGDKYPYELDLYKDKEFNKVYFYNKDLVNLWKSDIILESKNMILHGAPGTGKTYSVENSIKNRLEFLKEETANEQFKLVQFHPSYSYEDFIDGIKPSEINENGNMTFKLVNGEFKKMCILAANELKNNSSSPKKFYFIADEINRAELSRVFGELLLCLEDDKRLKYKDGKWQGTKVITQNSSLWKEEHAVIVEDGKYYFGVPENLYFIGTMNDIDRSVDSFDMALRRRFFWKHYKCDYDVIYDKYVNDGKIDDYIQICKKLNEHIIAENGFNLGSSYELGHSYFMKISNINNTQINKLWDNHIAPLLKEYLRSEYSENDIAKELKKAKDIFKIHNDTNS
jgi:5-methylcytosine-specific restriction endonuclease McrBC GTP-binding regulatory subunit McrB